MDWATGSPISWQIGVNGLTMKSNGTSVGPLSLSFPVSGNFDVSNLAATAQSLGISVANLELFLRVLIARAALQWGSTPGYAIAALLGLHSDLAGLPVDWPVLTDPSGPGSAITAPVTAFRNWLNQISTSLSSSGAPFLRSGLSALISLLSNSLPASSGAAVAAHAAPTVPPLSGSGTYDDPWCLPLLSASQTADLLAWLEPAGPPASWASALAEVANSVADFPALLEVVQALGPFIPGLADAVQNLDLQQAATGLTTLSSFLSASDGVVPLSAQVPPGSTWTAGTNIASAHPLEPQDPAAISQISAQIDSMAGGAGKPRAVLLLGPAFSDHTTWNAFLGGKPLANFNFRVPNTNPNAIDLSQITDAVDYYTCDLNDDGTGNLTSLTSQIGLVVQRIAQLRPNVPVTLVAHSTAGVAARVFTNSNATLIQGLITLGTPHLGTSLPFLTDPSVASVVRLVQPLRSGMAAGPIRDAFDHYFSALDGYLPATGSGRLPIANPYPVGSFTGTPTTDVGGRPAFAIGSSLAGTLLQELTSAASSVATQAGGSGGTAPTHLSFGVRAEVGLPASSSASVLADAYLRAGIGRVALQSGVAEPTRPAQFLSIDMQLRRPGDWLAGEPGSGAARVRSVEFGLDLQSNRSGGVQITPRIVLHQASLNGAMLPRIDFATSPAQAQALLGAVIKAISTPAPPAASAVSSLLTALSAIGVTVTNPDGSVGISADAFAAITADPASFFEPRVAAALSGSGLAGFTGTASGPWLCSIPGLPLTAYIEAGSWTVGLRTNSSSPLPLGSNASLLFDAAVTLPGFATSISATLTVGSLSLVWSSANGGQLVAQAPPWLPATTLIPPPSPGLLTSFLNNLLPRLLLSSATSALVGAALPVGSAASTILTDLFGPNFASIPPDALFSNTAQFLGNPAGLGAVSGAGLDSTKLSKLLRDVNQIAGFPAGPGLSLPGGLQLTASGSGTNADPVALNLKTTAPIGGALDAELVLAFDQVLHPTPSGTLNLTIALPGSWHSATLAFGNAQTGLSVSVAPQGQTPIQILPTFSGLGSLAAGLEALLPAALDPLVGALSKPGPAPAWLTPGLNLAQALGIYDSTGGFTAHSDTLKTLLQADWLNLFAASNRSAVTTAAANMVNAFGVTPAATASGSSLNWSFTLSGGNSGTVSLTAGWDSKGPLALIAVDQVKLNSGGITASLSGGFATGAVQCTVGLGLELPSELGISVSPQFNIGVGSSGGALQFTAQLFPLASNSGNGPLEIDLAPQLKVTTGQQSGTQLVENWLLPLAANVALKAVQSQLNNPLWNGAPSTLTLKSLLTSAKILQNNGTLNTPLPDILTMVGGAIEGIIPAAKISISSTLNLAIVNNGGSIGLELSGSQAFDIGSYSLNALFGAPSSWGNGADFGLGLYLLRDNGSGSFSLAPELRCVGVGLGLTGANDAALVNLSGFRLGGFNGYVFFDAQFSNGLTIKSGGGGLELVQLGLPLGLATGGGVGGNPVAANLMQSGGSSGGDTQPVNPGVDISAWYWGNGSPNGGDGQFHILLGGQSRIFWIGIHSGFGPVYIDQLGVQVDQTQVQLLIDGSVQVNGLTAQADELTVSIPYASVTDPSGWTLDLKGLALGFSSPGIEIAGGLLKTTGADGTIEYDGLLLIQITDLGFIAVGAYSTPTITGTNDTYTSVFVFAGVFIVIGLPPIIQITGLGLGFGYNRELLPPTDINKLDTFLIVEALDNTAAIANDPMGALTSIGSQIPCQARQFVVCRRFARKFLRCCERDGGSVCGPGSRSDDRHSGHRTNGFAFGRYSAGQPRTRT